MARVLIGLDHGIDPLSEIFRRNRVKTSGASFQREPSGLASSLA